MTFATGIATVPAAEKVIDQLKRRAAMIWEISPEAVDWRDGCAVPAGANAGSFDPLPLAEIALRAARTAGPIGAELSVNAEGAGPAFATHVCDVEVDPETGHVTVLRYTAAQDVGRAATSTRSLCSTPSAIPAAHPASIALPPASRIANPAAAAR